MFLRKKIIPFLICLCLVLSGCDAEELISVVSELSSDKNLHSDWKAYYTEILNGELPEKLSTELEKNRMPKTLSSIKGYFLCDWNNDGTPELFLEAIQTRYVFVIAADESVLCTDVFGINPELSALVAKGTEGLSADPGMDEWSVYLPEGKGTVYFNKNTDGSYTINDAQSREEVTFTGEKAEAQYRQLFKKYVPGTVPLRYISSYPVSDKTGLDKIVMPNAEAISDRIAACAAFRDFCDSRKFYDFPIEFFNEVSIRKTFFDFEQDGIPELIITNASADSAKLGAFVFEYNDGEVRYIGKGPECSYYSDCIRGVLLGYVGNVWTSYTKDGNKFNSKLLETGHQYLPTIDDDIYMVKGFPIQELPYDTFAMTYSLEMSFYRA